MNQTSQLMRVLHIAAVDAEGGAARAALRLHHGLLAAGVHSSMLVKKKVSSSETVHLASPPDATEAFFWNLIETYYLGLNRTPISNTYFSIGAPGQDLSQHALVKEADILHLHWVADFQPPGSIARLQALGKPMVWTLHDQRPMTGGCHFSAGCARYQQDCARCPQLEDDPLGVPALNLQDQLQRLPSNTICAVAPSRWLAECARQSALFGRSQVEVIPYGIATERFSPQPRVEAKTQLGLPPAAFHFLFGADYGSEKRKGFEELVAALKLCWKDRGFRQRIRKGEVGLTAFGRPNPEMDRLPMPIKSFGYVNADEALSRIYSAANLFVLPSLEDNLPNTALEAMSCGTPVLAFRVGGLPDLVADGRTGRLVPAGDTQALSRAILSLAAQPRECEAWGRQCREQISGDFSVAIQAQRYLALYEQLRRAAKSANSHSPAPGVRPAVTGPQLHAIYPKLLLLALERFTARIKGASAAQRHACRELIAELRTELVSPEASRELTHREKLEQLKAALMAAEAERLARRNRRHQAKAAGTGILGFLKNRFKL